MTRAKREAAIGLQENSARLLSAILLAASFLVACGGGSSTTTSAGSSSSGSTSGGAMKTFQEGGTITLDLAGQAAAIKLDGVEFANTDSGYPDYVEIHGPGTEFIAKSETKLGEDANGNVDYAAIAGKQLPIEPKNLRDEPAKLTAPGIGEFPVIGGTLTLQKFEHGMNGRDWWEGRIEVSLQTATGPRTAAGTFAFCIVPVW